MVQDLKKLDERFEEFKKRYPELSDGELWKIARGMYDKYKQERKTRNVGTMQKIDGILKTVEVIYEIPDRSQNR